MTDENGVMYKVAMAQMDALFCLAGAAMPVITNAQRGGGEPAFEP